MAYQSIEFKVLDKKIKLKNKNADSPYILYTITCDYGKGLSSELGYFYHRGDVILRIDKFYRAGLKPANDKGGETIYKPYQIDGFGGAGIVETPFDNEHDPFNEYTEHDAKLEAWGDIHTAAPIVAEYARRVVEKTGQYPSDKELMKWFIHTAHICRDARRELTRQYLKEKK